MIAKIPVAINASDKPEINPMTSFSFLFSRNRGRDIIK